MIVLAFPLPIPLLKTLKPSSKLGNVPRSNAVTTEPGIRICDAKDKERINFSVEKGDLGKTFFTGTSEAAEKVNPESGDLPKTQKKDGLDNKSSELPQTLTSEGHRQEKDANCDKLVYSKQKLLEILIMKKCTTAIEMKSTLVKCVCRNLHKVVKVPKCITIQNNSSFSHVAKNPWVPSFRASRAKQTFESQVEKKCMNCLNKLTAENIDAIISNFSDIVDQCDRDRHFESIGYSIITKASQDATRVGKGIQPNTVSYVNLLIALDKASQKGQKVISSILYQAHEIYMDPSKLGSKYNPEELKKVFNGFIHFTGELVNANFIGNDKGLSIAQELLDDNEYIATAVVFLTTCGEKLFRLSRSNLMARRSVDGLFYNIERRIEMKNLSKKDIFALMDMVDLKNRDWKKAESLAVKTLSEIKREVEQERGTTITMTVMRNNSKKTAKKHKNIKPNLNFEEAEPVTTNIVKAYTSSHRDVREAIKKIDEKFYANSLLHFLKHSFNWALDKKSGDREMMGRLYSQMVKSRLVTSSTVIDSMEETMTMVEELSIDVPQICHFVGEILSPLVTSMTMTPLGLFKICSTAGGFYLTDIYETTLATAAKSVGASEIEWIWRKSGFKWSMVKSKYNNLHEFLESRKKD